MTHSMRKHMRHMAAALIAAALATQAQAQQLNAVVVTPQSGDAVTIALTETPSVTFNDESVVVTSTSTTVEYPIDEKATFTFTHSTGIEAITNQPQGGLTVVLDGALSIYGLGSGETVTVYNIAGQALATAKASSAGSVRMDTATLRGVLIVKTAHKTMKIRTR